MNVPSVAHDLFRWMPPQFAGEVIFNRGRELKAWKIEVIRRIGVPSYPKPATQLLVDAFSPLPEEWYGSVRIYRDRDAQRWVAELAVYDYEAAVKVFHNTPFTSVSM